MQSLEQENRRFERSNESGKQKISPPSKFEKNYEYLSFRPWDVGLEKKDREQLNGRNKLLKDFEIPLWIMGHT